MKDKDWVDHLGAYEREYADMIKTLQLGGVLEVTNIWSEQRPGEKCVTCGDVKEDSLGNKVPIDKVLTDDCDMMSEACFDYIFKISPKFGSPDFSPPDASKRE